MRKTWFVAILTIFFTLSCDLRMTGDELQVVNQKITPNENLVKITKQDNPKVLLERNIEKFNILWTEEDIVISDRTNSKQLAFSRYTREKAEEGISKIREVDPDYSDGIDVRIECQVKSILGSLVSFEIFYIVTDRVGNKPNSNYQIIVVDFSQEEALTHLDISIRKALELGDRYWEASFPFSLRSYYKDKQLISALYKQPLLIKALNESLETVPESLEELFEKSEWLEVETKTTEERSFVEKDSFSNFLYEGNGLSEVFLEIEVYSDDQNLKTIKLTLPKNVKMEEFLRNPVTLSTRELKKMTGNSKTTLKCNY
jgi:hypothetical protein